MSRKTTTYGLLLGAVCFALLWASVGVIPSTAQGNPTTTPSANGLAMVTANYQWKPRFETEDGVTMALVPPGCFQMGNKGGRYDQKPVNQQCFTQAFWIDKTEVTQAQFKQFGGKTAKPPKFMGDNRPVAQITWFEAKAYCELRGARLPTEAEWEYAARGPNNLTYPWGYSFDSDYVVYGVNPLAGHTADVGRIAVGASWVGALDMSGNVAEWVNSAYRPYPYKADDGRESEVALGKYLYVPIRGGAWDSSSSSYLWASNRDIGIPDKGFDNVGLRCARNGGKIIKFELLLPDPPSEGAKAFIDALYSEAPIYPFVCKALLPSATELKAEYARLRAKIETNGVKLDTSGLKYKTLKQSGYIADVEVSGSLILIINDRPVEFPFLPWTFTMENEDGWKYCGTLS